MEADGIGIPFPQRDIHLYVKDGAAKEKVVAIAAGTTSTSSGRDPQPLDLDEEKESGGADG